MRNFGIDPDNLTEIPLSKYQWNKFTNISELEHTDSVFRNADNKDLSKKDTDIYSPTISQRIKHLRRKARPHTEN